MPLPTRTKGERSPKGSKTELTVDKMLLLVGGRLDRFILNRSVLDSTHH